MLSQTVPSPAKDPDPCLSRPQASLPVHKMHTGFPVWQTTDTAGTPGKNPAPLPARGNTIRQGSIGHTYGFVKPPLNRISTFLRYLYISNLWIRTFFIPPV